jgi:hypothetical protein
MGCFTAVIIDGGGGSGRRTGTGLLDHREDGSKGGKLPPVGCRSIDVDALHAETMFLQHLIANLQALSLAGSVEQVLRNPRSNAMGLRLSTGSITVW